MNLFQKILILVIFCCLTRIGLAVDQSVTPSSNLTISEVAKKITPEEQIFVDRIQLIKSFKAPEFKLDASKFANKSLDEAKIEAKKMVVTYISLYEKELLETIKLDPERSPFNRYFIEIHLIESLNQIQSVEMLLSPESAKQVQDRLNQMVEGLYYYGLKFYGDVPDLKREAIKLRTEVNELATQIASIQKNSSQAVEKRNIMESISHFFSNTTGQLTMLVLVLLNFFGMLYIIFSK
jgi:hypothetical protein